MELINAVRNSDFDDIKRHLENGVSLEAKDDKNMTALMRAACDGKLDIVKLLVEHGADIDVEDHNEDTALCHAVIHKHSDVIKYLQGKHKEKALIEVARKRERKAALRAKKGGMKKTSAQKMKKPIPFMDEFLETLGKTSM
jgi:ankyrin repeat protein